MGPCSGPCYQAGSPAPGEPTEEGPCEANRPSGQLLLRPKHGESPQGLRGPRGASPHFGLCWEPGAVPGGQDRRRSVSINSSFIFTPLALVVVRQAVTNSICVWLSVTPLFPHRHNWTMTKIQKVGLAKDWRKNFRECLAGPAG